jgi:hypothetical protein
MPPEVVQKSAAPSLARTERWMQAVVLHTGSTEDAIKSPQAARQIPASRMPVLPSKTLTAHERLEVYREMYWLRLRDALAIDYPELQRYLGNDVFDLLCDSYVQSHPSRSYTLNRLGDHMPRFLADGGFESLNKRRPFVTELARLELLMTEVFDEEEAPVRNEEQVAKVPLEAWDGMKLRAIPALRLGEFRYPVSEYISAVRDEKPAGHLLNRKDCRVLVCRRNHSVSRLELSRTAYRLFTALTSGQTLGDAVASVRVRPEMLQEWFKDWVANRVFRSIE